MLGLRLGLRSVSGLGLRLGLGLGLKLQLGSGSGYRVVLTARPLSKSSKVLSFGKEVPSGSRQERGYSSVARCGSDQPMANIWSMRRLMLGQRHALLCNRPEKMESGALQE